MICSACVGSSELDWKTWVARSGYHASLNYNSYDQEVHGTSSGSRLSPLRWPSSRWYVVHPMTKLDLGSVKTESRCAKNVTRVLRRISPLWATMGDIYTQGRAMSGRTRAINRERVQRQALPSLVRGTSFGGSDDCWYGLV
ncbi:hypothetical protein BHE74_00057195 [Ensete ventricosum]|nr:hypothetical protein BHE74_00057195 [Ensete ventricosum]